MAGYTFDRTETATAAALKVLTDPTRLLLVNILATGPAFQKQIHACLMLRNDRYVGQSTVAHHLGRLVAVGLVARERQGRWVMYRLIPGAFTALASTIRPLRTGYARTGGDR